MTDKLKGDAVAPSGQDAVLAMLAALYGRAYKDGHQATVEGGYTDVFHADAEVHWLDTVGEWLAEHPEYTTATPAASEVAEAVRSVLAADARAIGLHMVYSAAPTKEGRRVWQMHRRHARALALALCRAHGPAILAALNVASAEWQPIETAPRDGRIVLGWFTNPRWPSGPGMLQWTDFNGGGWTHYANGTPTHWMPLPEPPAILAALGGGE